MITQLLANQSLTKEHLHHKQQDDLRNIVRFAVQNTDYYRDRFCGFEEAELKNLPLLRKQDVTANLDALLVRTAKDHAKLGHTGGSTGCPLAFWYDDAKHALMRAGMTRSYMMSGWQPGQKIINFWGAARDIGAGGVFDDNPEASERTLPAQEFNETKLQEWAEFILAYQPVLLQGYASALTALADFIIDHHHRMPPTLLGIYSTAEMLDDHARERMKRAFGCHVFNQYGSREIPNIACECQHGNMHIFTDMVFLESLVLEDETRLIVTSLTNRLMPMIRYDIGDSGQLKEGDCRCGSPFPLMEVGLCRKNDFIRTTDGRRIHPSYFNRLLYGETRIKEYQWVQDTPDHLTLNIVPHGNWPPHLSVLLQDSIQRDLDMRLDVKPSNTIARTLSGKRRFVIGLPTL
ncbi:MAG: hypothetical protein Q8O31_06050 [Rhodocyclaceae bacterium]|nr:hypothetical protein [Rhodocyclaceae bacterium]